MAKKTQQPKEPPIKIVANTSPAYLDILIPVGNKSKFRCKTPNNAFGQIVSACNKKTTIPADAYIEWQISYSTDKKEISISKKEIRSNLFLCELSDILSELKKVNILTETEIDQMKASISTANCNLDTNIDMQNASDITVNNLTFQRKNIILPNYCISSNGIDVNIVCGKQQRAYGVQPMVYLNIPISSLENSYLFINQKGKSNQTGTLRIDSSNISLIIDLVNIFASLSEKYKNDMLSILNAI